MTKSTSYSRRSFVRASCVGAFALAVGAPWIARGGAKYTLKVATLAPQNSTWMNTFRAVARDIEHETGGEVAFKLYGGGVMGDESAMVRKMRTGQLDGAAVTSVGLGDIHKDVLMLQLPLLFRSYAELDRVRDKMKGKFADLLAQAGFVLLGWGDVGPQYLFSNSPIRTPADIKATKMWVWDADPISREFMRVSGANAVPLGVPDVLPSLQTGVVNAFSNSPYGAIALQWSTKASYVTDLKLAMVIGGSVLTARAWDRLPSTHQQLLKQVGAAHHGKLLAQIRKDNDAAVSTLKRQGIQIVSAGEFAQWKEAAEKTRTNLTGNHFDPALVREMLGHAGV